MSPVSDQLQDSDGSNLAPSVVKERRALLNHFYEHCTAGKMTCHMKIFVWTVTKYQALHNRSLFEGCYLACLSTLSQKIDRKK
ncbi:unnamed protein product [Leuciscus chuanchicus]